MINVTFSITDIDDAITLKNWAAVSSYIKMAEDVIDKGGKVIFQQEYENAPPDVLKTISSEAEIKNWKDSVFEVIKKIKKIKDDSGN